jgi:hypothetical protein
MRNPCILQRPTVVEVWELVRLCDIYLPLLLPSMLIATRIPPGSPPITLAPLRTDSTLRLLHHLPRQVPAGTLLLILDLRHRKRSPG